MVGACPRYELASGGGGGAGNDPAVAQVLRASMAVAIRGGLSAAIVLTLLAVPARHAAAFRVKRVPERVPVPA